MKMFQLIILSLLFSTGLMAGNSNETIELARTTGKTVLFQYSNFANEKTELSLKDGQGKVLFRTRSESPDQLPRQFRFEELEGDEFTVSLSNGQKTVERSFSFEGEKVETSGKQIWIYKPEIVRKGSKVWVALQNPSRQEVVIEVTNANGELLIPSVKLTDKMIRQPIDFSKYYSKAVVRVTNGEYFQEEFRF
jgi:hypothetical protein